MDFIDTILQTVPAPFILFMIFVYGACVGSFLNVCIYRIPAGKSVVRPGSHCGCGKPIAWYDNIPILSWIFLRGKARCCGRHFSIRYPLVEALTGALFILCWMTNPPMAAIAGMIFVSLMVGASFIDYDHMIIPDSFSVGGLVAGVILSIAIPSMHLSSEGLYVVDSFKSFIESMQGALIGSAIIVWIRVLGEIVLKREAMGFGDVTLMGAIGAFCGWEGALFAIFGGAIVGSLLYGLGMLLSGFRSKKIPEQNLEELYPREAAGGEEPGDEEILFEPNPGEIPFGPSLAIAGVLYYTLLREPVNAYFENIKEVLQALS